MAQPDLSLPSLSNCLSFPIHLIQIIEREKQSPWDHSHRETPVIYSDTSNRVEITFSDKDNVFLIPFSGKPDSAFLSTGKEIIQCTIGKSDSALNWFFLLFFQDGFST